MSQVLLSSWNKVVISSIICIFSVFWQKNSPLLMLTAILPLGPVLLATHVNHPIREEWQSGVSSTQPISSLSPYGYRPIFTNIAGYHIRRTKLAGTRNNSPTPNLLSGSLAGPQHSIWEHQALHATHKKCNPKESRGRWWGLHGPEADKVSYSVRISSALL